MSKLDEFIEDAVHRIGSPCRTCLHPRRKEVERDSREFNERRKAGLRVSWDVFCKKHLAKEYDYLHEGRSLLRHLEQCVDLEVH